ncbi:MAG: bifunctional [glutamate--ammonia ligase]-adenylyl-L-tyrosine phosphorylase/[glutamate--ammonia-ligase] adenylyltransferase [Gammaproteobacteria bacterium]
MDAIAALTARGRERLTELGLAGREWGADGALARAFGYSDFLHRLFLRLGPEAGAALLAQASAPFARHDLPPFLAAAPGLAEGTERAFALIALRELTDAIPVRASLLAASVLAEAVLAQAIAAEEESSDGFVVFGLGKLGGRELNFYSDLDLVFAHADADSERDEEIRLRRVQRLLARLEPCYRIDLRLRPFGGAGRLVMGFAAMEAYFQHHGREWERYAWIKARPVAGERRAGREFLARLHPFLYRRYLDYHAIDALREMKRQIAEEAGESERDIKRGPGGIREIEFIAQAFQLVRGGRESALAGPRLMGALGAARRLALLSARENKTLIEAYCFLRRVENRLQMQNLAPEHKLPETAERRARLAASLGQAEWPRFERELDRHRDAVRHIFDGIFGAPSRSAGREPAERLWHSVGDAAQARALAVELGFRAPEASMGALASFKAGRAVRLMRAQARIALDRVAPELIAAAAAQNDPDATLARLLGLLAALVRRSAYLALLVERPAARERLAKLVGTSPWIAQRLAASPVALDELLDPRLVAPAPRRRLVREFAAIAALMEPDRAAERLRETNEMQRLKIAAGLLDGSLSPAEVEKLLSQLADRAVRTALALASARMRARHGALAFDLLAIGYGKLGSRELGFASDLDLVFVYETADTQAGDGLAADTYLARLAQRTISLLSLPTAAGSLYAVDTRLRPEGAAGLLLSSFDAWRRYQQEQAWLWERQALLRARPVAGSPRLARVFHAERRRLLAGPFDGDELAREIVAMRARVAASGPARSENAAALIDGEFLAAYWVLGAAAECPGASASGGLGGQLEALAGCGFAPEAGELAAALAALRAGANCRVLGLADDVNAQTRARDWIAAAWTKTLGGTAPL